MTIRIPKGVFLLDTFSEQKGREFVASGVVFPNVLFFCRVEHSISLLFTLFLFAMPRLEMQEETKDMACRSGLGLTFLAKRSGDGREMKEDELLFFFSFSFFFDNTTFPSCYVLFRLDYDLKYSSLALKLAL